MSSLQKQVLKNKLPPVPLRSLGNTGFGGRKIGRRRDYTPVTWDSYFETYKDVELPDKSTFRIYFSGKEGPLLLLLHGGGYSGLSWSLLSASISQLVECQIAAIDLRGHGETASTDDDNLSADTLSSDIGDVFKALYGDDDPPPVILVGHSMGGAIAVHAVYRNLLPTAIGLVVIDVVEGTALDALQSMQSFLRSRPSSFTSLQHAIEWCVRSGQVRNVESARVSMPGQLKNSATNLPATHELQQSDSNNSQAAAADMSFTRPFHSGTAAADMSFPRPFHSGTAAADSILEEAEDDEDQRNNDSEDDERNTKKVRSGESLYSETSALEKDQFKPPAQPVSCMPKYIWRIDLAKTEKFWTGWFEGLSNMFLSTSIPKLLLLAGVDRLDKDLTIGQMQGKFQMQVLPQCGHAVHEDVPDKVAEAIATFMVRHKFTNPTCDFQKPFCAC